MNQDLRTALRDLANTGADNATPATLLAGRATNRVAALHRRRRVAVSALTIAGVTAAGAATAAAISYFGHDKVSTFPDRPFPSIQVPATLTGLQCGGQVGDLTISSGPLVLGNEMADAEGDTRVTINTEAASIIPMYLRNVSAKPVTFTTGENPGIYLVKDGVVVAVPVTGQGPVGAPAGSTLAANDTQALLEDRVTPCPDSSGVRPATIPAGDYDAYGAISITLDTADTNETDVVGGPWKVRTTHPKGTSTDEPELPAALPQADPDAIFPQCGALLDPPSGRLQIKLYGDEAGLPLSETVAVDALNVSGDDLAGTATRPRLVAVKEGIVVGSADTASDDAVPFDLSGPDVTHLATTGLLRHTLCTDAATPLPPGRYSIWASQEFTITQRVPYVDYVPGDPITEPETYTTLGQVATLWMDADGLSAPHPGLAEGWPQALDEEVAYEGGNADPETVVWLAISTMEWPSEVDPALIPARDRLADLGYEYGDVPFRCQDGGAALGITPNSPESWGSGTAVIFSTREAADAFVALWEPLHGPVVGVVTDSVGCHFD